MPVGSKNVSIQGRDAAGTHGNSHLAFSIGWAMLQFLILAVAICEPLEDLFWCLSFLWVLSSLEDFISQFWGSGSKDLNITAGRLQFRSSKTDVDPRTKGDHNGVLVPVVRGKRFLFPGSDCWRRRVTSPTGTSGIWVFLLFPWSSRSAMVK